jgi:DMSO/TMAO reductase YedYZ molybdopterin-dependent catalytic subunit
VQTVKKPTKITLILFVLLVISVVPLYIYTHPDSAKADALQITGNVGTPLAVELSQLQNYSPLTMQITLSSSSRPSENGVFNYTGVPLKDLLAQAGASTNASSVYIQALDGYGTTITIQEAIDSNTILAYQKDSVLLSALKDGGEGPVRLIIGDDVYAQRWIRGVAIIEVR